MFNFHFVFYFHSALPFSNFHIQKNACLQFKKKPLQENPLILCKMVALCSAHFHMYILNRHANALLIIHFTNCNIFYASWWEQELPVKWSFCIQNEKVFVWMKIAQRLLQKYIMFKQCLSMLSWSFVLRKLDNRTTAFCCFWILYYVKWKWVWWLQK